MDPGSDEYEVLKCPVCFEIPEDQVFLCQNGHSLCGQCSTSIEICPQCRVSLATVKVRNRTLEVLLDELKFGCFYKDRGCPEKVGRKDIKRHMIDCLYSGKRIDFCRKMGFHDCWFSTNLMSLEATMHHFQTVHNAVTLGDTTNNVIFAKFDKTVSFLQRNAKNKSFKWTPVIIDLNPGGGASSSGNNTGQMNSNARFMLLSSIHGQDGSSSWIVVCLSPEPAEAAQFHAEFFIKSLSQQVPDLYWQTPTTDATKLDRIVWELPPFRVPLHTLQNHYVSKTDGVGNLVINLKVSRINEKPKRAAQMADRMMTCNGDA